MKSGLNWRDGLPDRKPDIDGVNVNIWKQPIGDLTEKELTENSKEHGDFEVKYCDMTCMLTGFNHCKIEDKVIFLFKWKHDKKDIVYYDVECSARTEKMLEQLKKVALLGGYNVIDATGSMKEAYWYMKQEEKSKKPK